MDVYATCSCRGCCVTERINAPSKAFQTKDGPQLLFSAALWDEHFVSKTAGHDALWNWVACVKLATSSMRQHLVSHQHMTYYILRCAPYTTACGPVRGGGARHQSNFGDSETPFGSPVRVSGSDVQRVLKIPSAEGCPIATVDAIRRFTGDTSWLIPLCWQSLLSKRLWVNCLQQGVKLLVEAESVTSFELGAMFWSTSLMGAQYQDKRVIWMPMSAMCKTLTDFLVRTRTVLPKESQQDPFGNEFWTDQA